jgi:outer membrane phospholipase A
MDPTQGGQEITLRLKAMFKSFLPILTIQYFNGYGEGLLAYNEAESIWRIGIGF